MSGKRRTKAELDFDENLGRMIMKRRLSLSMSRSALGKAAGCSVEQVRKYECGQNRIAAYRLFRIVDRLGARLWSEIFAMYPPVEER